MVNALTVDVEDYFQVTAFERYVRRDRWDTFPLRVVDNTLRVLDLLAEFGVKGTFFVLGWVAERRPVLVKRIAEQGHEIACHGYGHELVYRIGPARFRDDVRTAKKILEDITGEPVWGYRAPSYSITGDSMWALDILAEEGFSYDSSIFPVIHDIYGIPSAILFPHRIRRGSRSITEFPLTVLPLRCGKKEYRLPIAGGGYLRLFPELLLRHGIGQVNRKGSRPAVLYFHPWEIDPEQPRIEAGLRSSFRHYLNLRTTERKLRCLLRTFEFNTMHHVLSHCGGRSLLVPVDGAVEAGAAL